MLPGSVYFAFVALPSNVGAQDLLSVDISHFLSSLVGRTG
jgi:hypothetical protein